MMVYVASQHKSAYFDMQGRMVNTIMVTFFIGNHGPFYAEIPEGDYNVVSRVKAISPIVEAVRYLIQ